MEQFKNSYSNIIQDDDMNPTPIIKKNIDPLNNTNNYPAYQVVSNEVMTIVDLDTLFSIFYFEEN